MDNDDDGVLDIDDRCPIEDANGYDADEDGCADSLEGLEALMNDFVSNGAIRNRWLRLGLTSQARRANIMAQRNRIHQAIYELQLLKSMLRLLRAYRINTQEATMLIDYIDNVIWQLRAQLPPPRPLRPWRLITAR
jgi:hypothetical protein